MAYHKAKEAGHEQVIRWHGCAQGEDRACRVFERWAYAGGSRDLSGGGGSSDNANYEVVQGMEDRILLRGGPFGVRFGSNAGRGRPGLPAGGPLVDSPPSGEPRQNRQPGCSGAGTGPSGRDPSVRPDSFPGRGGSTRTGPVPGGYRPAGQGAQDDDFPLGVYAGTPSSDRVEALDSQALELAPVASPFRTGAGDAGSLSGHAVPSRGAAQTTGTQDLRTGGSPRVPGAGETTDGLEGILLPGGHAGDRGGHGVPPV